MTAPTTKEGQALLEAYRDLDDPMRQKVNFANGIAAIERGAHEQGVAHGRQQERERIRAAVFARDYGEGDYAYPKDPTDAILAEPSE